MRIQFYLYFVLAQLLLICIIITSGDPTAMPTEHQKIMQEEYEKLLKERSKKKQQQHKQKPNIPSRPTGISPHQLGMSRNQENSSIELTHQVFILKLQILSPKLYNKFQFRY